MFSADSIFLGNISELLVHVILKPLLLYRTNTIWKDIIYILLFLTTAISSIAESFPLKNLLFLLLGTV